MKTTKIVSLFLAVLTALSVSACGVSGQSASSCPVHRLFRGRTICADSAQGNIYRLHLGSGRI